MLRLLLLLLLLLILFFFFFKYRMSTNVLVLYCHLLCWHIDRRSNLMKNSSHLKQTNFWLNTELSRTSLEWNFTFCPKGWEIYLKSNCSSLLFLLSFLIVDRGKKKIVCSQNEIQAYNMHAEAFTFFFFLFPQPQPLITLQPGKCWWLKAALNQMYNFCSK